MPRILVVKTAEAGCEERQARGQHQRHRERDPREPADRGERGSELRQRERAQRGGERDGKRRAHPLAGLADTRFKRCAQGGGGGHLTTRI